MEKGEKILGIEWWIEALSIAIIWKVQKKVETLEAFCRWCIVGAKDTLTLEENKQHKQEVLDIIKIK